MSTANQTAVNWEKQFSQLIPTGISAPAWLTKRRQQAIKNFTDIGLPSVRDEQWRYTNLRALKKHLFSAVEAKKNADITLEPSEHSRMVFVDGVYRVDLSNLDSLDSKIQLLSLADCLANETDFIEPYFSQSLPEKQHGFTALNTAHSNDGFVLILPNNLVNESTVEVCFISSTNNNAPQLSYNRNLIIAEANSQCSIIERHIGTDGNVYLNNTVTEIHASDNAHIDHYKLHQESSDAFHIGGVFIHQAASSQVKTHNVALGGLVCRNDIVSNLLGQSAHVEMNGLVIGNGRRHIDNHTEVNHAVPNCTSDEYYRTIMDEQSRSIFRGRIIVAKDAQQTSAEQQNNNLLLSARAEANTMPQLEIYADDVQCSHGATVGQLDSKSMFYLQSRGIDQDTAKALLTFAFANEVIERIKVDSIRQELTHIIAGEMHNGLEELL